MTVKLAESTVGRPFIAPDRAFASMDANAAARLVSSAAEVALVIDEDGIIRDLSSRLEGRIGDLRDAWIDRAWQDVVAPDSRPKVQALMKDLKTGETTKNREINHIGNDGELIPLGVSISRLNEGGTIIALGRDLKPMSLLQQTLVNVQLNVEREYNRLRQAEMRYRLLFQVASEAMVIADAETDRIIEANPSADILFDGVLGKRGTTRSMFTLVKSESQGDLRSLLASVSATGKTGSRRLRISSDSEEEIEIAATVFREGRRLFYLLRFAPSDDGATSAAESVARAAELSLLSRMPDAFVVIDGTNRIVSGNTAFLNFCEVATEAQVLGQRLDMFVGRPGVDIAVLMKNLREHGSIPRFATICRGSLGGTIEIEISAVSAPVGDDMWYGFALREALARPPRARNDNGAPTVPAGMDNFAELVGRVPLKDLVRESTDLIEKRCIEAALGITGGNRASAAEMLGLSRQSLYVKLRRYEIGEDEESDDSDTADR